MNPIGKSWFAPTVLSILLLFGIWVIYEVKRFNSVEKLCTPHEPDAKQVTYALEPEGINWSPLLNDKTNKCLNIEELFRHENTATVDEIAAWRDLKCLGLLDKYYMRWLFCLYLHAR